MFIILFTNFTNFLMKMRMNVFIGEKYKIFNSIIHKQILSYILVILFIVGWSCQGYCVVQWNKSLPSSGDNLTSWPTDVTAQWSILDTLLSNYRVGESLTYKNSTTLTVTSGQIVVSNSGGSARLFLQDSSNTDITSANLDSGSSFAAGTTYYVYAATSSSTASSSTYYISLSSSAPTGPTYYVKLGSFTTDGSSNILAPINNNSNSVGIASSKSIGTAYQASTDGFVNASASASTNTGSSSMSCLVGISNPPTTQIQGFNSSSDNSVVPSGGCSFFVPKGYYYKITVNNMPNNQVMYFTPTGN